MDKPNGGPAFPMPIGERHDMGKLIYNDSQKGMTLRDYFAAAALQGYMANPNFLGRTPNGKVAESAYNLADAMLKARKNG